MKTYYKTLTIAGSDSCGGAGIQADLKTFSALGCYGMSVIAALTAQNTLGVRSVQALPAAFVEDQLDAVLSDVGADAVKIGMLFSIEVIEVVARKLSRHRLKNIVLDPVMVSQSGDRLLQEEAAIAVKELLLPLATVATPNLPEAEALLGRPIRTFDEMEAGARELSLSGAQSILIKGGHLEGPDSTDILYIRTEDQVVTLQAQRVQTRNNHGTGCTLSSAIAAYLARRHSIEKAVRLAKTYLTHAVRAGAEYEIGHGHGPVHHFHEFW